MSLPIIWIYSGNHDMERIREYLDYGELKLVYAFLLSMPGAPAEKLYTAQDSSEDAPVVSKQIKAQDSLWHEIQKLIKIRRDSPALCAFGTIEFVYCEPEKYSLVYLRSDGKDKILAALNPSKEKVSCKCPYKLKEIIYTLGNTIKLENDMLSMPGESAAYVSVV